MSTFSAFCKDLQYQSLSVTNDYTADPKIIHEAPIQIPQTWLHQKISGILAARIALDEKGAVKLGIFIHSKLRPGSTQKAKASQHIRKNTSPQFWCAPHF